MQKLNPQRLGTELARTFGSSEPDESAQGHVLGRWCEQAVRLAYHITRDREAALDLSQEAVVKALHAAPSNEEAAMGQVWFTRIVVNLCRDWLRRQAVERKALDACLMKRPDPAYDPAHCVQRQEQLELTRQAMMALPLDFREALALVAVEGCSTREAALALDVPEGTLRWRLSEARALLKAELERQDGASKERKSP